MKIVMEGARPYTWKRLEMPLSPPASNPAASARSEQALEISLFNGRDLIGWTGMPQYWSVKDGAIVGKSTKATPNNGNTFLVWQGGDLVNFEFSCKYKLEANNPEGWANSGIQFRAFMREPARFAITGYQAELDPGTLRLKDQPDIATINGCFVTDGKDDRPGHFWINVGQKVVIRPITVGTAPVTVTGSLGENKEFVPLYKSGDWNDEKIIAVGNRFQIFINGRQTVDAVDENNRYTSGLLGLQMQAPQIFKTIQFKDLRLRVLKANAPTTAAAPKTSSVAATAALARKAAAPFSGTLTGTIWTVQDSLGESYFFEFAQNGVMNYEGKRGLRPNGKWRRDGSTVSIEINDGVAKFSGTLSGNQMRGNASSTTGGNWTWEARPR